MLFNVTAIYNVDLINDVLFKIIACYPHLQIGERLTSPAGVVKNGKVVDTANLAFEEYTSSTVGSPVLAQSLSIRKPIDITYDANSLFIDATYIHPYSIIDQELGFSIGDEITITDPVTFEPKTVIVTEEYYNSCNKIIFRFALA